MAELGNLPYEARHLLLFGLDKMCLIEPYKIMQRIGTYLLNLYRQRIDRCSFPFTQHQNQGPITKIVVGKLEWTKEYFFTEHVIKSMELFQHLKT